MSRPTPSATKLDPEDTCRLWQQACVRNTRHTVGGLVQWHRLGLRDDEILNHHPDLSHDHLGAAWSYYGKHLAEIDQTIRDDEDA